MAALRSALSRPLWAAASLVVAAFLVSSPVASASSAWKVMGGRQGSTQSWALGVVVPNGAELAEGARLYWAEVRNITAVARLPNITQPDGVTYLVLSAEGNEGSVLQVAAGVWPGCTSWSGYSWYITGLGSGSASYRWVMNDSTPSMAPGDLVSISISVGQGSWGFDIRDLNTGGASAGNVASPTLTSFASGDQEVFALESYTQRVSTFEKMGNATLTSLLVDGQEVVSGWYVRGGWDPGQNPMFNVGGAAPPTFISLVQSKAGQVSWSYDAEWTGEVWNTSVQPVMLAYASLAALVPIIFLLSRRLSHADREGES